MIVDYHSYVFRAKYNKFDSLFIFKISFQNLSFCLFLSKTIVASHLSELRRTSFTSSSDVSLHLIVFLVSFPVWYCFSFRQLHIVLEILIFPLSHPYKLSPQIKFYCLNQILQSPFLKFHIVPEILFFLYSRNFPYILSFVV